MSKTKASWDQKPMWLVWVKKTRPHDGKAYCDLRSVCTNEALAELHRDMIIRDEPDAEEIWVEKRDCDHLYAQRDVGLAFRLSLSGKWERE